MIIYRTFIRSLFFKKNNIDVDKFDFIKEYFLQRNFHIK